MSKVTDDILKKVSGGQGKNNEWSEWLWGLISNKLSSPLLSLKNDPTYGKYAECVLQVIQSNGLGMYDVAGVCIACNALKGTNLFQGDEQALEYLEAISEYVIDSSKIQK